MRELTPNDRYVSEAVKPTAQPSAALYALGMELDTTNLAAGGEADGRGNLSEERQAARQRLVLLVSKVGHALNLSLSGAALASVEVLEGAGPEPGFNPPMLRRTDASGRMSLGPFGVAIVSLGSAAAQ